MTRHLISLRDLSDADLRWLVSRAAALRSSRTPVAQTLAGTIVGTHFRQTSTRTRTAFTSAALRLGAHVVAYGPADLQLATGETYEDTGRVLSTMIDVLVVRTAGPPGELRAMADQDQMSVINAMTEDEHPTQALSDFGYLHSELGSVDGLRFLYVGEGNNTAAALSLIVGAFDGVALTVLTPEGYGLPAALVAHAGRRATARGGSVRQVHSLDAAPVAVDVVYTTRWETTGTSKSDPAWRRAFEPFRVDDDFMARHPDALFMHDLPAHRGDEVTGTVLDGAASVAFAQAGGKMPGAMAVLEWCRGLT